MVGRNHGAAACHILHDEGGVTGNVFTHILSDHAGPNIVSAAGENPTRILTVLPSKKDVWAETLELHTKQAKSAKMMLFMVPSVIFIGVHRFKLP